MVYDIIVVGAGPAGSTVAREAAAAGASVLLLDRATFPRDKPCGGGVNVRAARLLPFPIEPVTERTINTLEVSLNLNTSFARRYGKPLSYMTQRLKLDAYLAERAVASGVRMHDGEAVRSVDVERQGVTVTTRCATYEAHSLVGADGANGVVARATGLAGRRELAVALEANFYCDEPARVRWHETIGMDLGVIPGGYGWLFPKGDHLNIGVGGWKHFAASLRTRLDRLIWHYGLQNVTARQLRGHHLPVRAAGAPLARGRALLVGDAAGLVDPLSGEGIYGAIYSGSGAARHLLRFLDGESPDLTGYAAAIEAHLGPDLLASQRFQDVFHLMPTVYVQLLRRSDRLWGTLCRLVRGEENYLSLRRQIGPMVRMVDLLSVILRRTPLRSRVGLPP